MKFFNCNTYIKFFLCTCLLSVITTISLADNFVIEDIRVLGLQRVSAGTVFTAIKVSTGETISEPQLQDMIRDLFATGFFEEVSVGRDGNVLVISIEERPVISEIYIEGNKVLKEEPLLEGLKAIGLAEGEVFKQSALEAISKQLSAQYSAFGRYSATIDTFSERLPQNQIVVGITINEGQVAKIKHINIVGNTQFKDSRLLELFSLNKTGVWSWISGNDKYAKEKLAGDIERLKSYYLDRGFLKFAVTSTQVSLSPDKETVFITVNVDEGQRYTVNQVELVGDPVLPEEEIRKLITINEGDVFSQLAVTVTEGAITKRLGNEGYSSAQVSGSPEINDELQTVKVVFFIRPGSISYVRRIVFSGNTSTADHVLRREMRQIEGSPVSSAKLELSRTRLLRLGFFSDVKLVTRDVPGTTDQIDVEFQVTEQSSASVNFSLGYSGLNGVTLGAGVQHSNWLGSGNNFGFNVELSETQNTFNLNFRNPYYTKDGVSRGIRLFFRERDFDGLNVTNYATDTYGLKVTFGYPISEVGRLSMGLGVENLQVKAGTVTAQEIQGTPIIRTGNGRNDNVIAEPLAYVSNDFYKNQILPALDGFDEADTNDNGIIDEFDNHDDEKDGLPFVDDPGNPSGYTEFNEDDPVLRDRTQGFLDKYGENYDNLVIDFGWSNSTYDRGIFPTRGSAQRLNFEVSTPLGDLEYYRLVYDANLYLPVVGSTIFHLKGRFGYGDTYGDLEDFPFFENFFAGGVGSVRGFEPRSLGPKATPARAYFTAPVAFSANPDPYPDNIPYVYVQDEDGQLLVGSDDDVSTFGGNILVEVGMELIVKTPFVKNSDKLRTVLFVDAGNVFATDCGSSQANCDNVDLNKLSVGAGIGLQWLSPLGPLSFYLSKALKEQPFDQTEQFQFSLGQSF